MKPAMDSRFGAEVVRSRAGLEQNADVLIDTHMNLLELPHPKIHCVLVDECQFLEVKHIEQLREMTLSWDVPVICYGLRTGQLGLSLTTNLLI